MKSSSQIIEEYRKILDKDPSSKVFAPLAEALREQKQYAQAEYIAQYGIQRHPSFVGGYVAMGRILSDQSHFKRALPVLQKATSLDPQNILAWQLLANSYLQLDMTKEALKAYKMMLFLNPNSEKAKKAVQKLESFSAEEFEEEIFQYSKPQLPRVQESIISEKELERKLSLVDALIVRNQFDRAQQALMELNEKSPNNPEIQKRFELLDSEAPAEQAEDLMPIVSREKIVIERKRALLEGLLRRIRQYHQGAIDL